MCIRDRYNPVTGCTKEPRELCAPAGCGFVPGDEFCFDKQQTIVQDAPKEECSLEPQRTCKHVTKLVPKLEPTEECVDVPKEVCTRSRTNPRPVKKPVVKKVSANFLINNRIVSFYFNFSGVTLLPRNLDWPKCNNNSFILKSRNSLSLPQ